LYLIIGANPSDSSIEDEMRELDREPTNNPDHLLAKSNLKLYFLGLQGMRMLLQDLFLIPDIPGARAMVDRSVESGLSRGLLRPYRIALEYLDSDRDAAVLERQQPEMREAVLLLVNQASEESAGPSP
jgi:hypothetical protein